MVYFSELKGRPVLDVGGESVGPLIDLLFVDGKDYAEITHLIYAGEDGYCRKIPFGLVKALKEDDAYGRREITVKLNVAIGAITPFFVGKKDLRVGEILDKQVVDVNGAKVVRVNDILLGKVGRKFCVVAAAVGKRSLVRRLGLNSFTKFLPKHFDEHVISWETVEALEPKLHDIHLKVQKSTISDLHPEDIADVMEDLSHRERVLIFQGLEKDIAAETLISAEPEVQDSVFKDMKIERIKDLLEDIPPEQAADILSLMNSDRQEKILSSMRAANANPIRKILDYPSDSAGAIMDTSFISVPQSYTSQQTIDYLRKIAPSSEMIYHVYVVDSKTRLMGVLSIRGLLAASPGRKVKDFMKKEVIHLRLDTPKEDIAKAIAKYDLFVLPVVDDENVLRGVVTSDEVLEEIMPDSWRKERYRPFKIKRATNGAAGPSKG